MSLVRPSMLSFLMLLSLTAHAESECLKGEHWVDSHYRRAHTRYDGVHVKATQVQSHCRKNPKGYERWSKRLSNGNPTVWGYRKEKEKKWTVEEVERLHKALSVLPDVFLNLKRVKIYRKFKSQEGQNPATTNPPLSDVTLYDLAFVHKDSLSQIISHELSHILFEELSQGEMDQFAKISDWVILKVRGKTTYVPKKGKKNIQKDSFVSLSEDFANHLEEYLFDKKKLRIYSPKSFDWIQKKYGNRFKIKKRIKK